MKILLRKGRSHQMELKYLDKNKYSTYRSKEPSLQVFEFSNCSSDEMSSLPFPTQFSPFFQLECGFQNSKKTIPRPRRKSKICPRPSYMGLFVHRNILECSRGHLQMLWESVKCDFGDISKWPIQKLIIETNLKLKNQQKFLDRPRVQRVHLSSKN